MSLNQAVSEAIKANLSGVVADELQTFITKANKDAAKLEITEGDLKRTQARLDTALADLAAHATLTDRDQEQNKREEGLFKRELEVLRSEAGIASKVLTAELAGVKDTVDTFLRNVTVRQTVVADVTKIIPGAAGGNGSPGSPGHLSRNYDNKPDTTTVTEEKQ